MNTLMENQAEYKFTLFPCFRSVDRSRQSKAKDDGNPRATCGFCSIHFRNIKECHNNMNEA